MTTIRHTNKTQIYNIDKMTIYGYIPLLGLPKTRSRIIIFPYITLFFLYIYMALTVRSGGKFQMCTFLSRLCWEGGGVIVGVGGGVKETKTPLIWEVNRNELVSNGYNILHISSDK